MEAEPLKAEPPKRKRRWFQFSLRTLLIVVTVVAVILPTLPLLTRPTAFSVGFKSNKYIDPDASSRRAAVAADLLAIGAAVWLVRRKDKDRKRRKLLNRAAKLRKKSDKLAAKQLRMQSEFDSLLAKLRRLRIIPISDRGESRRPESASNT
jgi:hypothetical protein